MSSIGTMNMNNHLWGHPSNSSMKSGESRNRLVLLPARTKVTNLSDSLSTCYDNVPTLKISVVKKRFI